MDRTLQLWWNRDDVFGQTWKFPLLLLQNLGSYVLPLSEKQTNHPLLLLIAGVCSPLSDHKRVILLKKRDLNNLSRDSAT